MRSAKYPEGPTPGSTGNFGCPRRLSSGSRWQKISSILVNTGRSAREGKCGLLIEANPYAPPKTPPDLLHLVPAERGCRAVAYSLDFFTTAVPCYLFLRFTMLGEGCLSMILLLPGPVFGLLVILMVEVVFLAINCNMLVASGQTLGKKLLRIRIATLDGNVPSLWKSYFVRRIIFALFRCVPWLGDAIAVFDVSFIMRGGHKCLHDELANTIVLKA